MTRSLCYNCSAELTELRGKLICPACHMIIETCCEGGLCTFSPVPGRTHGQEEETAPEEEVRRPPDNG